MINKRNVIVFVLLTLMYSQALFGQLERSLDRIVIEENNFEIPFNKSTRSIEVFTTNDIKYSAAKNISEILQYAGSIDVRRRGPNSVQADMTLRGSSFEQVLILINGVKVIDPQTAHHVMNIPIDVEWIERIEIIKGSAGRIYGQGAFAGAVNIVTKKPKKSLVYGKQSLGEYGLLEVKVGGNYQYKNLGTLASYAFDRTDPGYRINNSYTRHMFNFQSHLKSGKNKFTLLASHVRNEFGANSFYAAPFDSTAFEKVYTTFASLNGDIKWGKTSIKPSAYLRANQDEYTFIKSNPAFYQNLHKSLVYGLQVRANTILGKAGALGYGFDVRQEQINSNNLGERNRFVYTANIEYKLYAFEDRIKIIPGASYNSYSDFGEKVLWGVDLSADLAKHYTLFGSVGTTYRIPSYTELYYRDRVNIGNDKLVFEEALTYEAGLKYNTKTIHYQLSYFKRNGQNTIDWIKKDFEQEDGSVKSLWQPDNITDLPIEGIEFSQVYNLGKKMFISPLRKIRMSYTFLDGKKDVLDGQESRYLLEYIRHQYNASLYWSFLNTLKFTMSYRFIDRLAVENYSLWDFDFTLSLKKKIKVGLTINNAFDKKYFEYKNVPMPGRWIRGSIKAEF